MEKQKWIARTKYGDFEGTSAADLYDSMDKGLEGYLESKGISSSQFKPIGLRIQTNEYAPSFTILCKDLASERGRIVSIGFEEKQNLNDLLKLFKRCEVLILSKSIEGGDYDWPDPDLPTIMLGRKEE